MKFFKAKIFALIGFSLFLVSCSPSISVKAENSDDATIKVIDTQPLKKAAHELAKQGTNLNQFMKFLNTYGVKVFDPEEAKRVLEKEVSSFSEIMEALAALRREADRNNIHLQIEDFDNLDNE